MFSIEIKIIIRRNEMKKRLILINVCLLVLLSFLSFEYLQAGYSVGGKKGSKITKVQLLPQTAKVKVGKTRKFTANVIGKGKFNRSVLWSVDGGDVDGTFSSTGSKQATYQAPDSVPEGGKVIIPCNKQW